jgi:serine O-acetyltransferase
MQTENSMGADDRLDEIAEILARKWGEAKFPSSVRERTHDLVERSLRTIFPQFADAPSYSRQEISDDLRRIRAEIDGLVDQMSPDTTSSAATVGDPFVNSFPELRRRLRLDAIAIFDGDPAAQSVDEVILSYPGFLATAIYRIAHRLWELEVQLIPRLVSTIGHARTGVDIHPAAKIGRDFCIDHGTGVVIGETAVIGNGVKLYQGVTLGALNVQKGLAKTKRHPTIEDNVVVYANATILGG